MWIYGLDRLVELLELDNEQMRDQEAKKRCSPRRRIARETRLISSETQWTSQRLFGNRKSMATNTRIEDDLCMTLERR